jgi:hypothetical protein
MRRETPHLPDDLPPICSVDTGLDDQGSHIRVLVDPSCRMVEVGGPGHLAVSCNSTQSCGDGFRVTPFTADIENLHAARRICGHRLPMTIGQTAFRLHCANKLTDGSAGRVTPLSPAERPR